MFARKYLFLVVISFLVIPAILMGCSAKPSDKKARSDLQKWFDSRWPSAVSVVEYQKTSEEEDGKRYTMYYQAKARFIKDTAGCRLTCCGETCFEIFFNGFHWISKASHDPNVIKKGDLFEMQGRATYKKTVKGWISEDF
jgi:hypothetical protein